MIGAILLYSYGAYTAILLGGVVHILYTEYKSGKDTITEIELCDLRATSAIILDD
jgi:hypothetical protein